MTPYTLDEFLEYLQKVEEDIGYSVIDIEKGSLVRGGSYNVKKNNECKQSLAMYGRLEPAATDVRSTETICKLFDFHLLF